MSDFLPASYEVTSASDQYMKFQKGDNRFRILDSPIIGQVYWNNEGKPVRLHKGDKIDIGDVRLNDQGEKDRVKEFWALPVWNYAASKVQVLEITPKGLLKGITELSRDADWGNPREYDLLVTRQGEGLSTEYGLVPKPKKEIDKEAKAGWAAVLGKGFDLNALYASGDPFSPPAEEKSEITPREVAELMGEEEPLPTEE